MALIAQKVQDAQTTAFQRSKGTWPAPLTSFTKYQPFTLIISYDPAIFFYTDKPAPVHAVFGGKVFSVGFEGTGWDITTECGDYYIEYWGMHQTNLKKGDEVKQGDTVGVIGSQPDKGYVLRVTLYDINYQYYPPLPWFSKALLDKGVKVH